jgi:hypothetical protein
VQECKDGFKTTKAVSKAKEAGEAAMNSGRWGDAITAFEAGEAADRTTPVWVREVRINLARALAKAKRYQDALAKVRLLGCLTRTLIGLDGGGGRGSGATGAHACKHLTHATPTPPLRLLLRYFLRTGQPHLLLSPHVATP